MASGFCCYTAATNTEFQCEPVLYSGKDCIEVFFDHLMTEERRIACILGRNFEVLPLTRDEQSRYDATIICSNCTTAFTDGNHKVRHHNHRTGKFIDAVCNSCNLQLKPRKRTNKTR